MTQLRGRSVLMVISIVSFTLLVILYHIVNDDLDGISSTRIERRLEENKVHWSNDLNQDSPNYYKIHTNNDAINQLLSGRSLFKGEKIVHIDLKGAPPKLKYYKYLFPLFRKLGVTGVLMEYEDMFPYRGKLQNIGARNCYSTKDIEEIQEIARANNLLTIPLIQTFGHMEFVLKLIDYREYREIPQYPQVLCPTYNGTLALVYDMIDQVLLLHPNSRRLHIGADEVYHIGECSRCIDFMAKHQWGKKELFLYHVTQIVRYIKENYPRVTILMWDDEFRKIPPQEIIDRDLHKTIEPVVWKYTPDLTTLTDELWESYAIVWKNIWIATAYKGATGPNKFYTNISYHMENHQRWLEIINQYSNKINFKGAVLTGWQRYDHFGVLCELLSTALPSLALNLGILRAPNLTNTPIEVPDETMDALQCNGMISLTVPEPQYGWSSCNFEGVSIYTALSRLFYLMEKIIEMERDDNIFNGWLNPYNLKYSFSNPSYVEEIGANLDKYRNEVMYIEKEIRTTMEEIYDEYTIDEWIETHVNPLKDKIITLCEAKDRILEKSSWPRRPLTKSEL